MQFNEIQKEIIESKNNCLVVGAPATGKTIVCLAKIKKLIADGVSPNMIAIVSYAPKNLNILSQWLQYHLLIQKLQKNN